MSNENKDLYYLHELSNYKVDSDYPDVRDWEVRDRENRKVGKVDNLLVSKQNERVVYLDVEVDESIIEANYKPYAKSAKDGVHTFLNEEGENHLILPIGLARLHKEENHVHTDKIDHRTFAETKRIKKNTPVVREYEVIVLGSYSRDDSNEFSHDNSFYDRGEFITE